MKIRSPRFFKTKICVIHKKILPVKSIYYCKSQTGIWANNCSNLHIYSRQFWNTIHLSYGKALQVITLNILPLVLFIIPQAVPCIGIYLHVSSSVKTGGTCVDTTSRPSKLMTSLSLWFNEGDISTRVLLFSIVQALGSIPQCIRTRYNSS